MSINVAINFYKLFLMPRIYHLLHFDETEPVRGSAAHMA